MTEDVSATVPHPRSEARNLQIQWLRAAAAIMVVLFHASVYGVALRHDDRFLKLLDGRLGISGVSLFFAISGYLMANAVKVQPPFTFLSHRVIRIYPAMLIATALYCGVEYGLHQPLRISLPGIMLAPIGPTSKYPLRVEWTLVFEVTFYIALFFIAWAGQAKRLPYIAAGWLALLAAIHWVLPDNGQLMFSAQRILTVCENVGMAAGLLIPSVLRLRLPPLLLLALGLASWPIYTAYPMANEGARWLFGIGGALVVAGAVGLSTRWPSLGRNAVGHAVAKFGDYSYALYLVHVPVIYTLYSILHEVSFPVAWAIVLVVTFIAAILLGRLDMALYGRLKSWLKTIRSSHVRVAMMVYLIAFFAASIGPGWKQHMIAVRQDNARYLAAKLGPIATIDQARQAALAAGLTPAPDLQGAIEGAVTDETGLEVTGWAVDASDKTKPALLALFQNGHLLDAGAPWFARPDIQQRFMTKAKTGFGFTVSGCDAANPIIGVVLSPDGRFAVLPQGPKPTCGAD